MPWLALLFATAAAPPRRSRLIAVIAVTLLAAGAVVVRLVVFAQRNGALRADNAAGDSVSDATSWASRRAASCATCRRVVVFARHGQRLVGRELRVQVRTHWITVHPLAESVSAPYDSRRP